MALTQVESGIIQDGAITAAKMASTLDLSSKTLTLSPSQKAVDYLEYRDEKTAGTNGGTATSGSFQTRTLNTEAFDTGNHGSLSSNQITLAAGTYQAQIYVPGSAGVNQFVAKLRNVTDSTDTLIGSVAIAGGGNIADKSIITGRFTIAAQKTFEVQMRVTTTVSSVGWGTAANLGVTEVYTIASFWRVA